MGLIPLNAGGNLQNAINNAQPGDVISLEAGATFRGPIELPNKSGSAPITIQSSRIDELPQGRVNPSHSGLMPKIVATHADQAIRTKPGANNYKLDGIEFLPDTAATEIYDLVRFGDGRSEQNSLSAVPHHLILDRCYVHGLPALSMQRGVSLNSSDSQVTRCYISDIKGRGMDAQAIASWNTPGRNKIIDCYLEAAGENVMFGGADPASVELIPSDIEISRCAFFKPLSWKGQGWVIKNLLEFKNAQRVLVNGCVFENNWEGEGQDGHSILFTVRNQEGTAVYSTVKDITLSNCTVKNCERGINFLGTDNEKPSGKTSNISLVNNFLQFKHNAFTINATDTVVIDRNTILIGGNIMTAYSASSAGCILKQNIVGNGVNGFGIFGDGLGEGKTAIAKYLPDAVIQENVFAGRDANSYPSGNFYPKTDAEIGLGSDGRLLSTSPFKGKGSNGKDLGVDVDALSAAQAGTTTGPIEIPEPKPTEPKPTEPKPTTPPTTAEKYAYDARPWPTTSAARLKLLNEMGSQGYRLSQVVSSTVFFEKTASALQLSERANA